MGDKNVIHKIVGYLADAIRVWRRRGCHHKLRCTRYALLNQPHTQAGQSEKKSTPKQPFKETATGLIVRSALVTQLHSCNHERCERGRHPERNEEAKESIEDQWRCHGLCNRLTVLNK